MAAKKLGASKRFEKALPVLYAAGCVLLCLLIVFCGYAFCNYRIALRKAAANDILYSYQNSLLLNLEYRFNYAAALAETLDPATFADDLPRLTREAEQTAGKEGVEYVAYIEGQTIAAAFPAEKFKSDVGMNFSILTYAPALAQLLEAPVLEGPAGIGGVEGGSFLFIQPVFQNEVYWGEVVVGLNANYLINEFNLSVLRDGGYRYELWRIHPETGGKDVIAISDPAFDFSNAAKTSFEMPTKWTLSVIPEAGWLPASELWAILILCSISCILVVLLARLLYRSKTMKHQLHMLSSRDPNTGLYTRQGFGDALDEWLNERRSFALFYFVMRDYARITQLCGAPMEQEFLNGLTNMCDEYAQNECLVGRVGEGIFAIALLDDLNENEMLHIAQGFALKLLWKTQIDGKREFMDARFVFMEVPSADGTASTLLHELARRYYEKEMKPNP